LELEVQVADELSQDGELLRVLEAEVRAPRADDVEELQADGRNTAEVTRSRLPLERLRELLDVDPGLEPRRIEVVRAGREEEVDSCVLRDSRVGLLVPWIARVVLALGELGPVHEEARDDEVVLGARRFEERDVPGVQRTHRRNEPDVVVGRARSAQLGDRADDPHVLVASASARYIGSISGACSWI